MTAVPIRLVRLHVASRRVPNCLLVLAVLGVVLRIVLHWTPASGVYAQQIPLIIEAAAAATVGLTARSPFGEPERATGRWLPFLRLGTVVALTVAAFLALAAGSIGGHLYGGSLGLLRNVAGLTGIALLTAAILGGSLSWTLPMGYLVLSTYAIAENWVTPWVWPARPPHDRGAAICAAVTLAAGLAIITVRGARDSATE
jgi:hypothetical protein